MQLDSYITPGKFDMVVDAVKTLCAFELQGSQKNVGTPSFALKIGYALKKCVNIIVGKALRDEATETAAGNF
jgi:hypothetical protein